MFHGVDRACRVTGGRQEVYGLEQQGQIKLQDVAQRATYRQLNKNSNTRIRARGRERTGGQIRAHVSDEGFTATP